MVTPVQALAQTQQTSSTVSAQAAQAPISNAEGSFTYAASQGETGVSTAAKVLRDGLGAKWVVGGTGSTLFDGHGFAEYAKIGNADDAASLKNMYVALDIIDACNELRRAEGVDELKVGDAAMAVGMVNANWTASAGGPARANTQNEALRERRPHRATRHPRRLVRHDPWNHGSKGLISGR